MAECPAPVSAAPDGWSGAAFLASPDSMLEGVYGLALGWGITELGSWQSVCPSGGLAAAPSVPVAVYLVRSNVCSLARPLILKTREWLLRITYFCLETSQGRE